MVQELDHPTGPPPRDAFPYYILGTIHVGNGLNKN